MSPSPTLRLNKNPDHVDAIVEILKSRATVDPGVDPREFFRNLLATAHLPNEYVQSVAFRLSGDPDFDARRLVDFAINLEENPDDVRFTIIGALLNALLKKKLPPDKARTVVAIMVGYHLVLDDALLEDLGKRYMVPTPVSAAERAAANYGPEIDWRGPASSIELQSFFRPDPPWLDVGFLRRAMERAASVCRVEIGARSGTGFVVSPGLVLTNFHVLKKNADEDIRANAAKATLRFGAFTPSDGEADEGQTYALASDPILEQSPTNELDFVLLRVEDKILAEKAIQRAPFESDQPAKDSALNILHHPGGDTMKLSLSGNGVTGVYTDRGLIQYATAAAGGSSGSPCFNDKWKVVALHHAQQSKAFGVVREGILIRSIRDRIEKYL